MCGLGKATHLLRTLPPALTQDFADALDTATLEAVERLALLDCLTEDQVAQLRLAARNGGYGLRSRADAATCSRTYASARRSARSSDGAPSK